jgi:outer membrane protein TolC
LLVLTLALAGCSTTREWWNNGFKVGPDYCSAKATVAESWIDASDPNLRGSEHDNACWWTAFGDPTLNKLVADASQQNLTLKMAGCRILQARAECGIAEGNLFPQQQTMAAQFSRNAMSANS